MHEPLSAKQLGTDQTPATPARKPVRAQEPLQRAIDPSRFAFYDHLLGHRPPAEIRLSPSLQQPSTQPVQRQEEEKVHRHEPISGEERSPMPRRGELHAQLWGNRVPPHLRLSPLPPIQQKPVQEHAQPLQRKENTTGLPDTLKAGIEDISKMSLDDVHVHYNSSKPAQVQALAYTQGTEIHVGPSQEQHLAHEAWHVVQQKQGRVQPTMQMKGLALSDDQGLEDEADVMGEKASILDARDTKKNSHELPADAIAKRVIRDQPAEVWLDRPTVSSSSVARQTPIVQRVQIRPDEDKGFIQAKKEEKSERVIETRYLNPQERVELIKNLGNNVELRKEIQKEWNDLDNAVPSLEELSALGQELQNLEEAKNAASLTKVQKGRLKEIAVKLVQASQMVGTLSKDEENAKGEEEMHLYEALISSLHMQVASLDKGVMKEAAGIRFGNDINLAVSQQERDAYRQDITGDKVWGGLAEADAIASLFQFSCNIFVLDTARQYQHVLRIGVGRREGRDLLFKGNHYEVVTNAREGQLHQEKDIQVKTEADGNCLFEGLLIIRLGRKVNSQQRARGIRYLRQRVSQRLTDDQVNTSVMEMLLSGQTWGTGTNMKQALRIRAHNEASLNALIEDYEISSEYTSNQIDEYKTAFLKAKTSNVLELAAEKLDDLTSLLAGLKRKKASYSYDELFTTEKRSPEREKKLREQAAREGEAFIENAEQVVITKDGAEYVIDAIGQPVPRYVRRNVSTENGIELKKHGKIYPSAISPLNVKKHTASGSGDAKITNPSQEMQHVQGNKPSPYLSATLIKGGAVNPQGKSFSGTPYLIDLAYVSSEMIEAVYSLIGIQYWLLDGYRGNKAEIIVILNSSSDSTTATELAKNHSQLSLKEWQALLDVTRTGEVLLSSVIPKAALEVISSPNTSGKDREQGGRKPEKKK